METREGERARGQGGERGRGKGGIGPANITRN